jgi:hydrogenase maturation protease
MPPTHLILGYGNTLRGDDGVGPHAASLLAAEGLHVISRHQLTPELAEDLAAVDLAVFLDAHVDLAPGEVRVESIEPVDAAPAHSIHAFDAMGLLQLTHKLYGRSPKAYLVGIGGESFELSETLSPAAEAGAREAITAVRKLLATV